MKSLSVSFTLGKESSPHQVNFIHNKRIFIANNVDINKTRNNITYVDEDVEETYSKLFDEAVAEYNKKVSRPCRQIKNYYKHILDSKREEAFYEAIVQFGDVNTAACGTESGNLCKQMLDEYMKDFKKRNPNLYVFYATMHLDEATPHLHIDFIPYYTKGRKNGLSKGVSMKAALIEQGFTPKNPKQNQLVAWEESERSAMEKILNQHGIEREDKNAHYEHMTVEQYKNSRDEEKFLKKVEDMLSVSDNELKEKNEIRKIKIEMAALKNENTNLKKEKDSPYRSFYFSSSEKQEYVMDEIRKRNIPIRETDNGFDAKEIYTSIIRDIEKGFKSVGGNSREKLREDIDKLIMQSDSFDEFLKKLKACGYEIKTGKYIAARPLRSQNFIRFKSLGEYYSEQALRNRLINKHLYEADLEKKIADGEKNNVNVSVLRVMRFYTLTFKKGRLPCRRIVKDKPLTWKNDEVLDGLTRLNNKINDDATLQSMRFDLAESEKKCNETESNLLSSRKDLKFFLDLKEQAELLFEGKNSEKFSLNQARETFQQHKNINKNNYKKIDELINDEQKNIKNYKDALTEERKKLKEAADTLSFAEKVLGGTYVQGLVSDEDHRVTSDILPKGFFKA